MPDLPQELDEILAAVAGGALSPSAAAGCLRSGEVRYLDEFAVLDLGRRARKGVPEIVYARGKTPEQVARICGILLASTERVIVSAVAPEILAELQRSLPQAPVRSAGRAVVVGSGEPAPSGGRVGALSAGTSDLPVMEEALPSVVAGLVAMPVVGLPTSTGYGLGGDGTAAILGMLQTCSPGLSVVNVDNGVGAGVAAALIANRAALGRADRGNGAEPG